LRENRSVCRRLSGRPGIGGRLRVAAVVSGCLGLLCSSLFVLAQVDRQLATPAALASFHQARTELAAAAPDQSLWSSGRKAAYRESLLRELHAPLALLRIPSIALDAPIFGDTAERALNRGIGWIDGTARPGARGNVGLAGHRDGFFRRLQDVKVGDLVEIQTLEGSQRYRITETIVVEPADTHVLRPGSVPSVTLVTCYPFYYVGSAPQRYVVRAVMEPAADSAPSRSHRYASL
jgi:sortase A